MHVICMNEVAVPAKWAPYTDDLEVAVVTTKQNIASAEAGQKKRIDRGS